uniref:Uncharacterized protein n=1 Tax=Ascaris lumbricoides TaxID=6252 RepID=A0A0M3HWH9_ASCLU
MGSCLQEHLQFDTLAHRYNDKLSCSRLSHPNFIMCTPAVSDRFICIRYTVIPLLPPPSRSEIRADDHTPKLPRLTAHHL